MTEDDIGRTAGLTTDAQPQAETVSTAQVDSHYDGEGNPVEVTYSDFTPKSTDGEACCDAAIPYVPYNIGIAILIMNIFLPGIGTLVSAYYDPSGCNCPTVTCGIF